MNAALKDLLLNRLRQIDGLEVHPSPVAGGTALFHGGRDFAHFHDDRELDLRLTRRHIQARGLMHPTGSVHHPGRSPNSAWIELRLEKLEDIERIAALVHLAITAL